MLVREGRPFSSLLLRYSAHRTLEYATFGSRWFFHTHRYFTCIAYHVLYGRPAVDHVAGLVGVANWTLHFILPSLHHLRFNFVGGSPYDPCNGSLAEPRFRTSFNGSELNRSCNGSVGAVPTTPSF